LFSSGSFSTFGVKMALFFSFSLKFERLMDFKGIKGKSGPV
jgi:hypothetical protein